ncbi:M48 family metallopeptidase [Undibacterium flavidum]|uniref:M48 family metallopeptidase n=1 Tax=Undibacterium flavidum TaxID=2762297 RepID=A0ABR6YB93_9BURK|nr:M48 family metallopeptidase [Undibacterium flavidum]MBC3873918.1 M48 family metallopeptidase [Undibacterium flavidum]
MINANFFNAQRSQLIASTLTIDPHQIAVHSELAQRNFSRAQTQVAEPYENAPLILQFNDGSHCEIHDPQDKNTILTLLNYQASRIERWQANWKIAILAIVLVMSLFYAVYRYGGPWIAKLVAPSIPQSADNYLGQQAQTFLGTGYFTPTETSDPQYTQIVMVFRGIKPASPRIPLTLEMRASPRIGPNALALPNGTIYVTDEMYALLSKFDKAKDATLSKAGEQELAGLLAHEIAHVELRHSMHNLVQTSLMTVLVGSMIGDFSSIAATAGSTVLGAQYSQEKESEADEYAIQLLKSKGISPIHMAHLFEALEKYSAAKKGDLLPAWFDNSIDDFLSSHPPTKQRIQRFKQAANAPSSDTLH